MQNNLAVLIDFENIAAGTEKEGLGRFDVDALMARVKDKGRVLVSRSYADWGRFARFKQTLLAANVTMMELTSHGMQDKNRADIAMVVDCLELAFTRDFLETFVVVSGDSDFTPLVLKLRELNKRVIGIGTRRSTSRLLINACDEFIFYDSIVRSRQRSEQRARTRTSKAEKQTEAQALQWLAEALEGMQRESSSAPLASVVKSAIQRRHPDFNENDFGFTSFGRFLEKGRDAGLISLEVDRKSGGYRVSAVEEGDELDDDILVEEEAPAKKLPSGTYTDPYFPADSERLVEVMAKAQLAPLAAPTRMAVLEALTSCVSERTKRRRGRINIASVSEDIRRRLRRTHPELPARVIRDLLASMMSARLLIHRDGSPIRSLHAQFNLNKNAEQLNKRLTEYTLGELKAREIDLSDVPMLAEFFYGDRDRAREIEETLAWTFVAPEADEILEASEGPIDAEGPASETDEDLFDMDDFLELDDEEPAEVPVPAQAAPEKELTAELDELDDLDAFLEADLSSDEPAPATKAPAAAVVAAEPAASEVEAPAVEDKPKKRTTRRRKATEEPKAEEPKAEEAKAEEPKAEEPAPKKRTTRKRKPTTAKADAPAEEATEPAAEEAPKKKTTRKRKAKAKPKAEAADEAPKPRKRKAKAKPKAKAKAEPKDDVDDSLDLDALLEES